MAQFKQINRMHKVTVMLSCAGNYCLKEGSTRCLTEYTNHFSCGFYKLAFIT